MMDQEPASLNTSASAKDVVPLDVSPGASSISSVGATPVQNKSCGHPRKALQRTDYSDFPINGTPEEQECQFKAKTTQNWRYNILNSSEESAYRAQECEHTKNYYHERWAKNSSRSASAGAISSQGSTDKDGLEGIEYLDVENDDVCTKEQEQS